MAYRALAAKMGGEEVLQLIGCLEAFSAKVSGMATLCSMCVYLFCWQLLGVQITAHHIGSFCLSCPAQKDSFTPKLLLQLAVIGCGTWPLTIFFRLIFLLLHIKVVS